ncbi:MAG: flagellar protein export ATPase FliI [Tuberibacillus sp.]
MGIEALIDRVQEIDPYYRLGRVSRVVGLMIESRGPKASIGDLCKIDINGGDVVLAEVVGFNDEHVILMPYTNINRISPGSLVESTGKPLKVKVGEELVGKVLNSLGEPMDGSELPTGLDEFSTNQPPPNPLSRPRIKEPLTVGVRSIDALLTVGKGQRMGIFAGSGVGKSTTLGMIARNTSADLNVIALIGERGREVLEFIENDLGEEGLKHSILVVATSDQPALMRIKGALTATAIAEYFRSKGMDVLLMMDSLTRVAMAQREVGLAIGEPPTTKGYTPSVFALLPQLLERTGTDSNGSITAFYTVLVDGGDLDEPIADAARGILDGHIVLERRLAEKGQYPAINILKSISRVMTSIISKEQREAAMRLRGLLAQYEESADLIQIGAYKAGSSLEIDEAIRYYPGIIQFLKQDVDENITRETAVEQLIEQFGRGE